MVADYSNDVSELRRHSCKKLQESQGSCHSACLQCANASGTHRLPLAVINKSAKPRCFKHMDMNVLPVHYLSQKKSWMDCKLFGEWFHQRFVPSVKRFCKEKGLEEKALLLLDNAPSHPSSTTLQSEDGKIKAMFLPPNTTAIRYLYIAIMQHQGDG